MNKIAANPFMITTGKYWLIGVQHRRRLLGQNRAEEAEVPRHCNQIGYSQSAPRGSIGSTSRASRKWRPSNVPFGYCSAKVGVMRTLRLSTVAAVCALGTVVCFVVGAVAMASSGVGVLIPETGRPGRD
jgi:hypothetical protein